MTTPPQGRTSKPNPATPTAADVMRRAVADFQAGNLAEAERLCRIVLGARPDHFDALHLSGTIAARRQRFEEADRLLSQALALNKESAEAHSNYGNVKRARGQIADALASYDRALALKPSFIEALNNRGGVLKDLGRFDQALSSYDAALALKPDLAILHFNRGAVLSAMKQYDDALQSYDRALALNGGLPEALNNRGVTLASLKRHEEALASYGRALALVPDFAEALQNRGVALSHLGRHEGAAKDLERALRLNPDLPFARGTLLHSRMHLCDWRSYAQESKRVIDDVRAGKRAIEPFMFLAISDSPEDQLRCSRTWVSERCPAATTVWTGGRYRHDRIRLAYVSSDFRAHPLGHLMAALFEQHDRKRFELIAVSIGRDDHSAMRSRLQRAFDKFVDAERQSDRDIVGMMREMEVDIAVDRNGFTTGARPGIFALRAAPVQVNYLAYPGTIGADFIDYLVADDVVIPRQHQLWYAENVVYLPDSYQPNDSGRRIAERTPTREEVGLPDRAFVFCSFNNNYKVTPPVFDVWMALLRQVEKSVLWLLDGTATMRQNLWREAGARGIDPQRLVFAPRIAPEDHLARHRLADLFLDTLPCNAHTTASDALWAGLPVVTCAGTTFAGRVGASLLRAVSLPELVAGSLDQYASLALRLASEPATLDGIRQQLARNRAVAPLFDTDRFRRHIEAAYVEMWERHERGERPASFAVTPVA
ncbi:MAG TPA: tetratricopeptide repeat protein [Casimicrobiaceae bacterium]|nr:tetratricopeptide repeat protein [Casimicrobiaceae bacterium]